MKTAVVMILAVVWLVCPEVLAADKAAPRRRGRRAKPTVKPVADTPGPPRVLLIGDSISVGYARPTRGLLAGKVNVRRIPTNGGPTVRGLAELDKWLGPGKWDVIHFNWGLHDLKYMNARGSLVSPDKGKQQVPPRKYRRNLTQLVKRLKKTGAKLIFATTTPVPKGSAGRIAGDAKKYNLIALEVMRGHGVAVNDLYTFILPTLEKHQRPANVHFFPAGSKALAGQVAASILKALARKGAAPQPTVKGCIRARKRPGGKK